MQQFHFGEERSAGSRSPASRRSSNKPNPLENTLRGPGIPAKPSPAPAASRLWATPTTASGLPAFPADRSLYGALMRAMPSAVSTSVDAFAAYDRARAGQGDVEWRSQVDDEPEAQPRSGASSRRSSVGRSDRHRYSLDGNSVEGSAREERLAARPAEV